MRGHRLAAGASSRGRRLTGLRPGSGFATLSNNEPRRKDQEPIARRRSRPLPITCGSALTRWLVSCSMTPIGPIRAEGETPPVRPHRNGLTPLFCNLRWWRGARWSTLRRGRMVMIRG